MLPMPLNEDQIARYSRQILVPQIGGRGQEHLLRSSVLCIGDAAPLRTATAYLQGAGVTVRSVTALPTSSGKNTFDLLIAAHPTDEMKAMELESGDLPVMQLESTSAIAWYSRRTRARDCIPCIRECGRRSARALTAQSPTPAVDGAAGAALALDVLMELLGLPGTPSVVAFGHGGSCRRANELDFAGCPHRVGHSTVDD